MKFSEAIKQFDESPDAIWGEQNAATFIYYSSENQFISDILKYDESNNKKETKRILKDRIKEFKIKFPLLVWSFHSLLYLNKNLGDRMVSSTHHSLMSDGLMDAFNYNHDFDTEEERDAEWLKFNIYGDEGNASRNQGDAAGRATDTYIAFWNDSVDEKVIANIIKILKTKIKFKEDITIEVAPNKGNTAGYDLGKKYKFNTKKSKPVAHSDYEGDDEDWSMSDNYLRKKGIFEQLVEEILNS